MNFQHKTKETDIQFFVLIPDTNIDVRDKIQFEKLGSEHSFCHDMFDLGFKDITGITFYQIIPVKVLLMDVGWIPSIGLTTNVKSSTPIFKVRIIDFTNFHTINNPDGFTMFPNPENKFNKSFHVV